MYLDEVKALINFISTCEGLSDKRICKIMQRIIVILCILAKDPCYVPAYFTDTFDCADFKKTKDGNSE